MATAPSIDFNTRFTNGGHHRNTFAGFKNNTVQFYHPDLRKRLGDYNTIDDALQGEGRIKSKAEYYLPNPETNKEYYDKRYGNYCGRAIFYDVSRRTLQGLIGQIFSDDPNIELPSDIEFLKDDIDGKGVSLTQQAKKALSYTLAYSRAGLLVDYPETNEAVTVEQQQSGEIRPFTKLYKASNIINWRVVNKNGKQKLSLVVLLETYETDDNEYEFSTEKYHQYRVLRLRDGVYTQQLYRERNPQPVNYYDEFPKVSDYEPVGDEVVPKDNQGNSFNCIPFMFIGSENNDYEIDHPFFYGLVSLNLAHYRNSADHEESLHITGQPTPVLTGLNQHWLTEVLKGEVNFGSMGGIPLPAGASAELLQASSDTGLSAAMEHKERQMVALGAQIIQQQTVQRTAQEVRHEATSDGSMLMSAALNVQAAFVWALNTSRRFVSSNEAEIKFELNTDFELSHMTFEEVVKVVEIWQKGGITFDEMRSSIGKSGITSNDLTSDEAKELIDAESIERVEAAQAAMNQSQTNERENDGT